MSRPPYLSPPPIGLAHRGGTATAAGVGIENSLAAFRGAVELGYAYLETDVHTTSDGVLVAFHDDTLDRTTDGTGALVALSAAELAQVRIGGREPVALLAELFAAFPQARVNVDIKAAGAVVPLVDAIESVGASERVCVGSFSPRRLWAFRRLARARRLPVATSASPIGTAWLRFAPAALTRWIHSPGIAYQVPVTQRLLGRDVAVVTPAFLAKAHAIGRQVHVWTINDRAEMIRLLDMGADGIVSDAIDVLAEVLAERNAWPPD